MHFTTRISLLLSHKNKLHPETINGLNINRKEFEEESQS